MSSLTLPKLPDITKLSPFVTRILGQNPSPFTLQGTNTYLVGNPNTNERVLIDTGSNLPEYRDLLLNHLQANNLKLTTVLVTHSHPDHILGVQDLLQIAPHAVFLKYGKFPEATRKFMDPAVFTSWDDLEEIEAAGLHFTAYYTPGHCIDHISIWLREEQALFSGDNLLGHGSSHFIDYDAYMRSLERMRDLKGLSIVYPGHGEMVLDGVAAFNEYLAHRRQRELDILHALQQGGQLTLDEIVQRIYTDIDSRPPGIKTTATRNTMLYLEKLRRDKKVAGNGVWRAML